MKDRYLKAAKEIVLKNIDKNTAVFLFGSRAMHKTGKSSDIDIGFISADSIKYVLRKISNELEESRVPYHVDLIDFTQVNDDFKKVAMENIEIWNKGNYFL